MLKKTITLMALFASVLLIFSCSQDEFKQKFWDYTVINKIGEEIDIEYQTAGRSASYNYIAPQDTVSVISYGISTKEAHIYDIRETDQHTDWKVVVGDETYDISESSWTYEEIDNLHANNVLVVDSVLLGL